MSDSTNELKKAAGKVYTDKKTSLVKVAKNFKPSNLFLGGVGLLAAWFAIREFKKMVTTSPEEQVVKDLDDDIEDEIENGNPLSFTLSQYVIFANIIEEATDLSGTDEDAIYDVFHQLGNNTDVLQLIKTYGERWSFWFGVPTGSYTLPQILQSEFDDSEKLHLREILDSKSITVTVV